VSQAQEAAARGSYGSLLALDDARSSGYRNQVAQDMRFESFSPLVDSAPDGYSVLDVGCGIGTLARHLAARKKPGRYIGLDVLPEAVERAREKTRDMDGVEFVCGDALSMELNLQVDVAILCDTYCLLKLTSREEILESIRSIWKIPRHGLAITLASRYSDVDDGGRATFSPEFILGWAMTHLSERVVVDHSYAPHVFTLIALKPQSKWRASVSAPRREGWPG